MTAERFPGWRKRSHLSSLPPRLPLQTPAIEPMDNATRSERSRKAGIEAALTIIARDGPGQLTFDAMARESGISKGGLMHQFPNKGAVLKALLDHQIDYFERFSKNYLASAGDGLPEPTLAAQIATIREAVATPASVTSAILAALVEDPGLLSGSRELPHRAPDPSRKRQRTRTWRCCAGRQPKGCCSGPCWGCARSPTRSASACLRACGTTASGQRLGARRRRQPNAQRASPRDAQRAVEGVGRMFAVSCRCMTTPTVALRPVKRSRSSW